MNEKEKRFNQLYDFINSSDETIAKTLKPTIEMVCDLEEKLKELQNQPFILYSRKNKAISKETPASKLYKSLSQIYDNKIKIIIKAVKKNNSLDDDGLEEFLNNWRNGE